MKWEFELAIGAILVAAGLALALTLPPPWWPRMPSYLVHVGILVGIAFLVYGLGLVTAACLRRMSKRKYSFRYLVLWDMAWANRKIRFGTLIAVAAVILLLPALLPTAGSQSNPPPPSVNGNRNNFGNNNINCNTFNIGPTQRQIPDEVANKIASALVATRISGTVAVQTDLMGCPDCDFFARQFEGILRSVPNWTVVSVRNGMTGLPFTHGVGLGVKNKNQMPDSAKALIAGFSVAGRVDVFEYPPPQGAESVILVGQRSLN